MRTRGIALGLLALALLAGPVRAAETVTSGRAVVEHDLPDARYALAIAKIVDFSAAVAVEEGFDMPERYLVSVSLDPKNTLSLSTTGDEQIHLTLSDPSQLLAPGKSHVFNVYGFCHEVGHCAMYRLIRQRAWMTTGAAEGWASYFGARVVDRLDDERGEDAWPDPHDYSDRGFEKSRRAWKKSKNEVDRGAYLWSELAEIVGDDGVAPLFRAIEEAHVDPFAATEQIEAVLKAEKKGSKLVRWWKEAQDDFVVKLAKSDFETEVVKESRLAGRPEEVAKDDGEPKDKASWPGDSAASVLFDAGGDDRYLVEVRIYGQRYGRATDESFLVWLLDEEFKPFRRIEVPYEKFTFGPAHWEKVPIEPTLVPRRFHVAVVFHAESTKGVFRFCDGKPSGTSFMGVPGESARAYDKGDWLIRAVLDRRKGR